MGFFLFSLVAGLRGWSCPLKGYCTTALGGVNGAHLPPLCLTKTSAMAGFDSWNRTCQMTPIISRVLCWRAKPRGRSRLVIRCGRQPLSGYKLARR